MEQQDLLQDLEQEVYLERASTGARFVNYLIDVIAFYVLLFAGVFIYAALGMTERVASDDSYQYGERHTGSIGLLYLVIYLTYIGYYTVFEGATKGRTLGKLITGTRAVRQDGAMITWQDALIRSLCRIVPFEPFSAFGNAWHDKWSNTQVVKNIKPVQHV